MRHIIKILLGFALMGLIGLAIFILDYIFTR